MNSERPSELNNQSKELKTSVKNKSREGIGTAEEDLEMPRGFFSPENENFFQRMSKGGKKIVKEAYGKVSLAFEKGRKIAGQIHEGIYEVPIADKIMARLEITYNKIWLNHWDRKKTKLKRKIDVLDLRASALDRAKKEINSVIDDLSGQNITGGVDSLRLRIKNIDAQRRKILNRRDKIQTRFESVENRAKLYANRRDRIVDRFIRRYNEKLVPLERELESLRLDGDHISLLMVSAEAQYNSQISRLKRMEDEALRTERSLRKAGLSGKEIKEVIENFDGIRNFINQFIQKIEHERNRLSKEKIEMDKKIARVDKKANRYLDKREKFIRIKEGRPLKVDVPSRQRSEDFETREEMAFHSQKRGLGRGGLESAREGDEEGLKEVSILISGWNDYLSRKYANNESFLKKILIGERDFLRSTRLLGNSQISFRDFGNILKYYYRFKRVLFKDLDREIGGFLIQDKKIRAN